MQCVPYHTGNWFVLVLFQLEDVYTLYLIQVCNKLCSDARQSVCVWMETIDSCRISTWYYSSIAKHFPLVSASIMLK